MSIHNGVLSKKAILEAVDLNQQTIEVPEWGGTVIIRELTGRERDAFEEGSLDRNKNVTMNNIRARLVAMSAIDTEGNRLFTNADAHALGEKSATALHRCIEASASLSGITSSDIDELEGNSEAAHPESLGSISQN